jgi:hypothetical protein
MAEAEITNGKRGIQAKSQDTLIVENRLRKTEPGDVVTYDELSTLLGRDVRLHCRSNMMTARHTLVGESIFFDCVPNEGYRRLTTNEAAFASDNHRERIASTARRGLRHLRHVPFDDLTDEAKKKHLTMSAQFGAIQLFGSTKATKKIEAAVKSTSPMAIGETLKLFGG